MKEQQVNVRPQTAKVQQPSTQNNPQQASEIRRLQVQLESQNEMQKKTLQQLDKAKKDLQKKVEELLIAEQDRTRFKDLSEGYMQEVARLEAQLEQADIKPKPKGVNRPKDTVKRE